MSTQKPGLRVYSLNCQHQSKGFFFFLMFIYLFIFWLRRVLVAARGIFTASCRIFSLRRTGSVVEACGLSYPAAFGTPVPRPGIKPVFPELEGGFLTTGPPGKSHSKALSYLIILEIILKLTYGKT